MTQHDTSSFKKAAVLTGLTVLVGGAEISSAEAATTVPEVEAISIGFSGGQADLLFNQFNQPGTLTGVKFQLNSSLDIFNSNGFTASVSVLGSPLFSQTTFGSFSPPPVTLGSNPAFIGGGEFPAHILLVLPNGCEGSCSGEGWVGSLSVSYTFDPPGGVPLPAALPLFASGAAGLGFMGWLRRLKQKAKKQA